MIEDIKLYTVKNRRKFTHNVRLNHVKGRIEFIKSPFGLKDEIKSMMGSRWHGFVQGDERKIWSVSNCQRNMFQLSYLKGENPYEWFDRPLEHFEGYRPELMDHQILMADGGLTYHYQIWGAEAGVGKGGLPTTPVLTPSGWDTMGSLSVGDEICDPEGGTCNVTGVYPRGKMEMFRVTLTDGSNTICSGDHLWRVITPNWKHRKQGYQVKELQELVGSGLQIKDGRNKYYIPMVEPVDFEARELKIHPYVMGYLLGNAHFKQYKVSVSDEETINRLDSFMSQPVTPTSGTVKGEKIDYVIRCPLVKNAIDMYGLKNCLSDTKFVPEDYLFNTVENRTFLLQGLLDSDGTPLNTSGVEFSSASENLAQSVKFLIQSLGGTCHIGLKEKPTYTYKGEKRIGEPSHRLNGSFWGRTKPFLLSRKVEKYATPTKYQPTRGIVSVESIGEEECICIKVDSPTHCYVTDEFIVTHNTLSAIEVIEKSNKKDWYWVGPLKSLPNMEREFEKWGLDPSINVTLINYERFTTLMDRWQGGDHIPEGLILDESSRVKNHASNRSRACQYMADMIREKHDKEGFVILMSGTPAPKTPMDWWSQAEITWPGFLKEGSVKALEQRLAFLVDQELPDGMKVKKRIGFRDSDLKCKHCGGFKDKPIYTEEAPKEDDDNPYCDEDGHKWESAKNEVSYMYERLKGLVVFIHKDQVMTLPDKTYRKLYLKPTPSTLRVAQALVKASETTIKGITLLRELSDGFQYRDEDVGMTSCKTCRIDPKDVPDVEVLPEYIKTVLGKKPLSLGYVQEWENKSGDVFKSVDMFDDSFVKGLTKSWVPCPSCLGSCEVTKTKRMTLAVKCPKDGAFVELLEENYERGRIVAFGGFTGSIDRMVDIALREGWDVVRCDGRGWMTKRADKSLVTDVKPLSYWADLGNRRVAFIGHPRSGGMSLTLTEASMVVFWSNSFAPEDRIQAEERIHRKGMDELVGATVVDLIHLPTDERVLEVIKANRKLEKMTMGEFDFETGF